MSAFFPSIEREFGWSRTAISGAFSLARSNRAYWVRSKAILSIASGRGASCTSASLSVRWVLSCSFVDSLTMLYVSIVLGIVLGSSLGYHMPISLLIAKIFHERRSLAFGIFRMGPGSPARSCPWSAR